MNTQILTLDLGIDEQPRLITVVVGAVDVLADTEYSFAVAEALGTRRDSPAQRYLSLYILPALIHGTQEVEGLGHWPPTFEELCAWPKRPVAEWVEAIFTFNPDWRPSAEPDPKASAAAPAPSTPAPVGDSSLTNPET